MPRFLIEHRHLARECRVAFAAWKGFESPLRRRAALASCAFGGHVMWWCVEAPTERDALRRLPSYVADRSTAVRVGDVQIP